MKRVKENLTEFNSIFSNIHFFEPFLISSSDLYMTFTIKYYNFIYISDDVVEIARIITNLGELFNNEYSKKVELLLNEYNPIENYNSKETETITTENSSTTGNENTTTVTSNGTTDTTGESTNKIAPYDSENFSNDTNLNNSTNSTTNSTDTTTSNDSGSINTNGTTSRTLSRSGNIGVTTTQQMIESEFELRSRNIIFEFLDKISKYILLEYID